jgi:AcrR family transcriptional regulator
MAPGREGSTRDRLLVAARDHLDQQGLDGLTLRSIARAAGLSHGAPLRHFSGLSSLLAAVATFGFRELHASVERAVADAGEGADPRQRLAAAGHGYVGFACANRGAFELMFRNEHHGGDDPELLEAGAAAFLQLVGLVEQAQVAGWQPDQDPGDLAALLWANVHGLASLWLPGTLAGALSLADTAADLGHLVELHSELLLATTATTATTAP